LARGDKPNSCTWLNGIGQSRTQLTMCPPGQLAIAGDLARWLPRASD